MNLKACTFAMLAFISLGFSRGAQVGKTSLLEVEFITAQALTLGVFIFFIWYASGGELQPEPSIFESRRLRPRRFDSTIRRVPKLRFERVSFLFLVCL